VSLNKEKKKKLVATTANEQRIEKKSSLFKEKEH
jgi:hypothetical protein